MTRRPCGLDTPFELTLGAVLRGACDSPLWANT
jgi:hypothetical protein